MEKDEQILLESFLFVLKESEEETNKEIRYKILMRACIMATLYQKINITHTFKNKIMSEYHKAWDSFIADYEKIKETNVINIG